MRGQPVAEQGRNLEGKAHWNVGDRTRARVRRGRDQRLDLMIVDGRDDWRETGIHRHPRLGQCPNGGEALARMRRARLQRAGERGIETGDRKADSDQALRGHGREQVDVMRHPVRLGRDHQWMEAIGEHLDACARDPVASLDRLIGVRVRPHRDRLDPIAALAKLGAQQPSRIRLHEQPALEIQARREIEPGMAGPGKAIDAAMLAARKHVHRLGKSHIW